MASCIYINTTGVLWANLKEKFSQSNGPRIFQLQKDISSLLLEDMSISDYYTQWKTLWNELLNFKPLLNYGCGPNGKCGVLKGY